jgi:hypothetical protein
MTPADRRKQENAELVARMKAGDDLSAFNPEESWFPVRPKIKKDLREIQRIHGRMVYGVVVGDPCGDEEGQKP